MYHGCMLLKIEYSDSESDDNVNDTTETNVDTSFAVKKQLPGGLLKIKRMKDANINRKAEVHRPHTLRPHPL